MLIKSRDVQFDLGDNRVLAALKYGYYDIYYRFDPDLEMIYYYAVLQEGHEGLPKALSFAADFFGVKDTGLTPLYFDSRAFVKFLYENEQSLTQGELAARYGDDYPTLVSLQQCDSDHYYIRQQTRKAFFDLFKEEPIKKENPDIAPLASANQTLEVEIDWNRNGYDSHPVFFKVNSGAKSISIPNSRSFLSAFIEGKSCAVRKTTIPMGRNDFQSPYDEVLDFVSKAMVSRPRSPYEEDNFVRLTDEQATEVASILQGHQLTICGRSFIVPEPTHGSIMMEDDGTMLTDPKVPTKPDQTLFAGIKGNRTLWVPIEGEILYLEFDNQMMAKAYYFLQINGMQAYADVKDLFAKRVLPKAGAGFLSPSSKRNRLRIEVYIGWTPKETVEFHTVYKLNGEEVAQEEFVKDDIGQGLYTSFSEILKSVGGIEEGELTNQSSILFFLGADLSKLKETAKVYIDSRLAKLQTKKVGKIKINSNFATDWCEVSLSSDSYTPEELAQLIAAYREKRKFVVLGDDVILLDDDQAIEVAARASEEFRLGKELKNEKLPLYDAFALSSYQSDLVEVNYSDKLQEAIKAIRDFQDKEVHLKESIARNLRPYQLEAVKWLSVLSEYGLFGILADDMGLGKTLEMIAFLSTLPDDGPTLVICPKSLTYNWAEEIKKWFPERKSHVIEGTKAERTKLIASIKGKDVYMVSYDSFRNDVDLYQEKQFGLLILDEAQFIKNSSAAKSKAVKQVNAKRRFALTGTPIENSLNDMWSIFDFLMPGYLLSESDFNSVYVGNDNPEFQKRLELKVRPFILRRTKEEVLTSLPPKTTSIFKVSLDSDQRALYESYMAKAREEYHGGELMKFMGMLTKIREICVDPSTFLEDYDEVPSKLAAAEIMVADSVKSGHRILIFSSFVRVLEHFRSMLEDMGIKSYMISGATKASDRVAMAKQFNDDPTIAVMLVSLKAGGTGLNLQGADTVLHLDPWWNLAAEDQATDRAYRIGQIRPVSVYKFICADTVEEKIVELQNSKKGLFDAFVKSGSEGISSLSEEDIKFLLS